MFQLTIETDNAAFQDQRTHDDLAKLTEIARILRDLADRLMDGNEGSGTVRDVNGNKVGSFETI